MRPPFARDKECSQVDLVTFLLADYASTTPEGKLNVLGIFGQIGAASFPTRHPQMFLVARLTANPAEVNAERRITIRLLDADAQHTLVDWSAPVSIAPAAPGRLTEVSVVVQLRDIVFPAPGDYQFVLLVDNDAKGTLPLVLVQTPAPGLPAPEA
jgi:hypothetical protein